MTHAALQLSPEAQWLFLAGLALFWIGQLGLLWRRSLIGMLSGVLFGWLSVVLVVAGIVRSAPDEAFFAQGALIIFCAVLVGALQVILGLSIVVARISRSGSLDAEDAGLLEG